MNRLFRPSTLIVISVALLGAALWVLWPLWGQSRAAQAIPRPVPEGDQEIVFLGAATNNAATWERFVAAIRRLQTDQPELNLKVVEDANAFPDQTTATPELAVTVGENRARLWLRWYKLTGETGTRAWVEALTRRDPPPLAIIGGGSSDRAHDLAIELNKQRERLAAPPLLLITTATADQVTLDNNTTVTLMDEYAGRSFRFCFTNRQMAEAVTAFIWQQDDLRPDAEPVYMIHWKDDPYSEDLFNRFKDVFWGEDGSSGILGRVRGGKIAARTWAWFAGRSAMGGVPPGLDLDAMRRAELRRRGPSSIGIAYSIGDYNQPNPDEEGAAERVMSIHGQHPRQQRPLVIVPAAPQPGRRFLRALMRTAPSEAGKFVVATGDGIDFNTVYRDRDLAWPVQDLPFDLVLFCHRNPVDPSAFEPDTAGRETTVPDPGGRTSTGTQDLLLYRDIMETVARAAYQNNRLLASADDLRDILADGRLADGRPRFDDKGNQVSGGGEYVVYLRPVREGDRVLPRALLQVWNRSAGPQGRGWARVPVAGRPELKVEYSPESADKREAHP